jgi:hypothetical protein
LTLALERVAVLNLGLKHTAIDRQHAATGLDPDLEHTAIDRKHISTILDPGPGAILDAIVDLKPATIIDLKHTAVVVNLKPVVDTPSVSLVHPLLTCECL